jgi:hypothetical protein
MFTPDKIVLLHMKIVHCVSDVGESTIANQTRSCACRHVYIYAIVDRRKFAFIWSHIESLPGCRCQTAAKRMQALVPRARPPKTRMPSYG